MKIGGFVCSASDDRDRSCCFEEFFGEGAVGDSDSRRGDCDQFSEFGRTQQRHGCDHYGTGFDHGEPAGHHPHVVAAAQQNSVAGNNAEVFGDYSRNLIRMAEQVSVRPG